MVVIHNDSLPTPSVATQPERKEIPTSLTRQETTTHATSAVDTLISQVTPLLGITPRESTQLQSTNTQEDVEEILGTRAFQRYVDMLGSIYNLAPFINGAAPFSSLKMEHPFINRAAPFSSILSCSVYKWSCSIFKQLCQTYNKWI